MGTRRVGRDLSMMSLRIGLGSMFLVTGWAKITNVSGVVALLGRFHVIAPPLMAPILTGVEFVGGLLILLGLLTRVWALLLAIDMINVLVIVKWPSTSFMGPEGWSLEWLALWMALALLAGGGGSFALDALLFKRPARRAGRHA